MKTKAATPEVNRSKDQAKCQLESICEMVNAINEAQKSGNENAREEAMQAIQEDPLSVEVRNDWHTPGDKESAATHFRILLCWGGPACQIIGELSEHNEPENPKLQYQDWGTLWTDYNDTSSEQDEQLLQYCQQFYFGE